MNKLDTIAVVAFNTSGECYQVALTESEKPIVEHLIKNLHDGVIKVLPEPLSLAIKTPEQ